MALTPQQQALEQITRAKRVLLMAPEHPRVETMAAAIACFRYLKKMNKDVDLVLPDIKQDDIPSFLPQREDVRHELGAIRTSLIRLNVKDVPLEELMYDVRGETLEITLVPKIAEWQNHDLSFAHGEDRYDLIITVDVPDLRSLGKAAQEQADFFYRTTIINIDHDPGNEHWGQMNVVDLNAVSTSEVLYHLFENWNRNLIDEQVATSILAGMIAATRSFRTPNVTPQTLSIASQLVAMGAKREEIVHGLWRTRDVATLKMWGRALSRLEQDRERGLVWTTLSTQDLLETGGAADRVEDVVHELISYAPEAKVVALFVERNHGSHGTDVTVHVSPPLSAMDLTRPFNGQGTRERAAFALTTEQTMSEGVQNVIKHLREVIKV